jgi:hypothetical protein
MRCRPRSTNGQVGRRAIARLVEEDVDAGLEQLLQARLAPFIAYARLVSPSWVLEGSGQLGLGSRIVS